MDDEHAELHGELRNVSLRSLVFSALGFLAACMALAGVNPPPNIAPVSYTDAFSGTGQTAKKALQGQTLCTLTLWGNASGMSVQPQSSRDGGSTWTNITTFKDNTGTVQSAITADGTYNADISAYGTTAFDLNVTALGSGTENWNVTCAPPPASVVVGSTAGVVVVNSPNVTVTGTVTVNGQVAVSPGLTVIVSGPVTLPSVVTVQQANTPGVFCVNCATSPPYVAPSVQNVALVSPLPIPVSLPTCPTTPNAPCVQVTGPVTVLQGGGSVLTPWTINGTVALSPSPNVGVVGPPPGGWTAAPVFPLPTDANGVPLVHATGLVSVNGTVAISPNPVVQISGVVALPSVQNVALVSPLPLQVYLSPQPTMNTKNQLIVAQGSPNPVSVGSGWWTRVGKADFLVGTSGNLSLALNSTLSTALFLGDPSALTWYITGLTGSGATVTFQCSVDATNYFNRYAIAEPFAAPSVTATVDGAYDEGMGGCQAAQLLVTTGFTSGGGTATVSWTGNTASPFSILVAPLPAYAATPTFNCGTGCPTFPPTIAISPNPVVVVSFPPTVALSPNPTVIVSGVPQVAVSGAPPAGWTPRPWPTDASGYPQTVVASMPPLSVSTCAGCPTPIPFPAAFPGGSVSGTGSLSLANGTEFQVPVSGGQGAIAWGIVGLTGSGATVYAECYTYGTTFTTRSLPYYVQPGLTGALVSNAGITSDVASLTQSTFGCATVGLKVIGGGTGTATIYYNLVASSPVVGLTLPLPAGSNTIGTVSCNNCTPNPANTVLVNCVAGCSTPAPQPSIAANQGNPAPAASAWPFYLSAITGGGATKYYSGAITTNGKHTICSGACTGLNIDVINGTAAACYVQQWDVLSANVTVGTTAPNRILFVAANSEAADDIPAYGVAFTTAWVFAITTTATGATGCGSTEYVNASSV